MAEVQPLPKPPPSPSSLDLSKLAGDLKLTVETENPQKLDHDLKKDAQTRRTLAG